MDRLEELKTELADEVAAMDLMTLCQCRGEYYDTDTRKWSCRGSAADVARALEYLELRGLLERHPDDSSLVRVKDEPA